MEECECIKMLRNGQYKLGFHSGGGHDGNGPCESAVELLKLVNEVRSKRSAPISPAIGMSNWDDIKSALLIFEYNKFTINGVRL